jgi:hypothetical protein
VLTQLVTTDIGPVSLPSPTVAPRHVVADHGHLWQWIGDGEELVSLSVAVRTTRLGTPTGVKHHLAWEVDEVSSAMDAVDAASDRDVMVMVDGATGSAAADVDGPMRGADVRNRIIVTTDGHHMHVVRALVRDTRGGRELAEAVTAGLRVRSWSMSE